VTSDSQLFKRVFLPALLFFAVAGFLLRLAVDPDLRGYFNPEFLRAWARVGYVMNVIHQDYYFGAKPGGGAKVAYDKLDTAALTHLLDGLDPYSAYLTPKEYQQFEDDAEGHFVGIGVELERRSGRIEITNVFPDSPAAGDGWEPGDQITAVGGDNTGSLSVADVADLLRGPENTTVSVTRYRPADAMQHASNLVRHSFDVPSVRDVELRPDGVGYLRLVQFGDNTGDEFAKALLDLKDKGLPNKIFLRSLVLDLRDNPGGSVEATAQVLDHLLPPRTPVVFIQGRRPVDDENLLTDDEEPDIHFDGRVAVLVNENTASAAEIVSGALRDTHRAVLVGTHTYGKGVVQDVMGPLSNGGAVKLTIGQYLLPNGERIGKGGLTPDVLVPLSPVQTEILRFQRSELEHLTPADFAARYGFAPLPDPQLDTAINLLTTAEEKPQLPLPSETGTL
jgi:carboxyl-terminal processing protease